MVDKYQLTENRNNCSGKPQPGAASRISSPDPLRLSASAPRLVLPLAGFLWISGTPWSDPQVLTAEQCREYFIKHTDVYFKTACTESQQQKLPRKEMNVSHTTKEPPPTKTDDFLEISVSGGVPLM